jgi:hypothetical protein
MQASSNSTALQTATTIDRTRHMIRLAGLVHQQVGSSTGLHRLLGLIGMYISTCNETIRNLPQTDTQIELKHPMPMLPMYRDCRSIKATLHIQTTERRTT